MPTKSLLTATARQLLSDAAASELFVSNLYQHLSNHMQRIGRFGAAAFFARESLSERGHYLRLADYFNQRGDMVPMPAIDACSESPADIAAAFEILKLSGFKVSDSVRTIITPSTREVMKQCAEAGFIQKFLEAGVVFTNPTCSLCTAEHYGVLPGGDVGVSTTNRNFIGKVGKGSHTYLVSPMTAMASAVKGVLTDPRDILK